MPILTENMVADLLEKSMPFTPTNSQYNAIYHLAAFLTTMEPRPTLLVNGFAGTGKTSLMKAFCDVASELHFQLVLMAPTGRAAKVLSNMTGRPAYTVHKTIYRQETAGDFNSSFELNFNKSKSTIFVVDEASMISDSESSMDLGFGSGKLLTDILSYVFSRNDSRLLIVGDPAQLPPVGNDEAPALDYDYVEQFGVSLSNVWLTDVVRQEEESLILKNAVAIRRLIDEDYFGVPGLFAMPKSDVERVSGEDLIEALTRSIDYYGIDNVLVVTRSNSRAKQFNMGIRNMVLYREDELNSGDMLIVSKNNYKWLGDRNKDFIANGDVAQVVRIRKVIEMYGLKFANVSLRFKEHDDVDVDATIMMNSLYTDAAGLTHDQEQALYEVIASDYGDLGSSRKLYEAMKNDPWYNALRVKFAYAVTCHKAQGGQWDVVFVDLGYVTDDMMDREFLKWLYTAFTRATKKLYLVNFSDRFFE